MKIMELKCPDCGAPLSIDIDNPAKYCSYCGTPIYFDDENRKIEINYHSEHIYRDEARIKEAENRQIELEIDKKSADLENNPKFIGAVFMGIILFLLFMKYVLFN